MALQRFFTKKKIFSFSTFVLLFLVIGFISQNLFLRGWFLSLTQPFGEKFYAVAFTTYSFFDYFQVRKELLYQREQFRLERDRLLAESARTQTLLQENEQLRSFLHFFESRKFRYEIANIVGKLDEQQFQGFLLDRGRRDGIEKGMAVISSEGIFLGKIETVFDRTSIMLLVIDNHSLVAVSVENIDRTIGILRGSYNLSLKIDSVPKTETLNVGEMAITSGLEEKIPRGLLLGRISEIITQPNDLFQSALLEPLVSYQKLSHVAIILPFYDS